jgi:hypothetical protein
MAELSRPASAAVKDYQAQLEKLRRDAAECGMIRDPATDKDKREMFDRLSGHLTVLADQVELAMLERNTGTVMFALFGLF